MVVDQLYQQIQHLHEHLKQLTLYYTQQQRQFLQLQQEHARLKKKYQKHLQKQQTIENLLNLSSQIPSVSGQNMPMSNTLIHQYIQTIDQCIQYFEQFSSWKNLL